MTTAWPEVGGPQREPPPAGGLICALPARKAVAGTRGNRLANERETVDLDVDVGVGGANDDDGRWRIGGGERSGGGFEGER